MGEGNQESDSGDSSYEEGETLSGSTTEGNRDSDTEESSDTEEAGSTTELGNHRQQGGRGRVFRRVQVFRRGRGACTVPQQRRAGARGRCRGRGRGRGARRGRGGTRQVHQQQSQPQLLDEDEKQGDVRYTKYA